MKAPDITSSAEMLKLDSSGALYGNSYNETASSVELTQASSYAARLPETPPASSSFPNTIIPAAMSCGFLDRLPREVRDQIYAYIVASTGRIVIDEDPRFESKTARLTAYPKSPFESSLSFDLLRTCKQIYEEAGDVYWRGNIFCIEILNEKGANPIKLLDSKRRLAKLIQRIEIRLWCAHSPELAKAQSLVSYLSKWARYGPLNEITFTISGMGTMVKFGEMVESRCSNNEPWLRTRRQTTEDASSSWDMLSSLLVDAGGGGKDLIGDPFIGVRKKMNILLGMKHTSPAAQKRWLNDHPPEACEETVAEMNRLLGGELYVDGILCYRDQVRLRETFRTWREDLEIQDAILDI